MSYGASFADVWHQLGVYAAKLIRGSNVAELPIQLPTRVLLKVNLKTAKGLNLMIPPTLLARADEVIE